jgi:L-2,4-diaminobutyric acid acetyltransferase
MDIQPYYTQALHFQERHKTENLVTIPLTKLQALAA